jgi:hypothetical protein
MNKKATVALPAALMACSAKVALSAVTTMNETSIPQADRSQSGRRPKRSALMAPPKAKKAFQTWRARLMPACVTELVMPTLFRIGAR